MKLGFKRLTKVHTRMNGQQENTKPLTVLYQYYRHKKPKITTACHCQYLVQEDDGHWSIPDSASSYVRRKTSWS